MKRNRAFTLVELIIYLALLSALCLTTISMQVSLSKYIASRKATQSIDAQLAFAANIIQEYIYRSDSVDVVSGSEIAISNFSSEGGGVGTSTVHVLLKKQTIVGQTSTKEWVLLPQLEIDALSFEKLEDGSKNSESSYIKMTLQLRGKEYVFHFTRL